MRRRSFITGSALAGLGISVNSFASAKAKKERKGTRGTFSQTDNKILVNRIFCYICPTNRMLKQISSDSQLNGGKKSFKFCDIPTDSGQKDDIKTVVVFLERYPAGNWGCQM